MLTRLRVDPAIGLASREVGARWRLVGSNSLGPGKRADVAGLLIHQFHGPIVYLLGAAAALAIYFGEVDEGVAIATVLLVNASIGFLTELRAVRSIESLRALAHRTARARRDGRVQIVPAESLVPGDIVLLDAGETVSADLRLIEASQLTVDESMLTGESIAVRKQTQPVAIDARLGDRASMAFRGTAVTRGSAVGLVVATGPATELGRIAELVLQADAGSSPLERQLARLSAQLVWAILALAVLIAAGGLAAGGDPFLIVEASIALAVAAIPEGLPIVATLALARGMWRMARQNALIERLGAVETLGATTVILTDKTGTLTENRMTVRHLSLAGGDVELSDIAPGPEPSDPAAADPMVAQLLRVAVLCNDATLDEGPTGQGTGDPMEIALLRAGRRVGLVAPTLLESHGRTATHAFDPALRMMATVHESPGEPFFVAVKGAPEAVIAAAAYCGTAQAAMPLDEDTRAQWLGRAAALAARGLRVLACGSKRSTDPSGDPYRNLILLGLIGLEDPVRPDVPGAIAACRRAGIRVVMVTGDHAVTARAIAHAAGLADQDSQVVDARSIGALLAAPDPAALHAITVFARVSPAEKLALVRAYQAAGEVVAMTGDGVNDAPALRQADIGVAMGRRGTEVAREAAAMVLLDDAFTTIVNAIREGRVIFGNIRRFVAYLLSCNLSEVMVIGLAVAWQLPLPVLPLQILYLNLVTDVFPAFALALGEGESGVLQRAPRNPKDPILGDQQWIALVLSGVGLAAATFASLAWAGALSLDARQTVTVTFLTLAFAQLWHAFDMRSVHSGLFANEVMRNAWLWASLALCCALLVVPPYLPTAAALLQLAPLPAGPWGIVLVCSVAPMVLTQGIMRWLAGRVGRPATTGRRP